MGDDTTPDSNPFEAGMARYVDVDLEPDNVGKARAPAEAVADRGRSIPATAIPA